MSDICFCFCCFSQLLKWPEFIVTVTLPERQWGEVSWWLSSNSQPWHFLCGSASLGRGSCCFGCCGVTVLMLITWKNRLYVYISSVLQMSCCVLTLSLSLPALLLFVGQLQPAATMWPNRATRWPQGWKPWKGTSSGSWLRWSATTTPLTSENITPCKYNGSLIISLPIYSMKDVCVGKKNKYHGLTLRVNI